MGAWLPRRSILLKHEAPSKPLQVNGVIRHKEHQKLEQVGMSLYRQTIEVGGSSRMQLDHPAVKTHWFLNTVHWEIQGTGFVHKGKLLGNAFLCLPTETLSRNETPFQKRSETRSNYIAYHRKTFGSDTWIV